MVEKKGESDFATEEDYEKENAQESEKEVIESDRVSEKKKRRRRGRKRKRREECERRKDTN